MLEGLGLGVAADATTIPSERNNLPVLKDGIHVLDRFIELPALDGASHLISVLVVGTQVRNSAFSRYTIKKESVRSGDLLRIEWRKC